MTTVSKGYQVKQHVPVVAFTAAAAVLLAPAVLSTSSVSPLRAILTAGSCTWSSSSSASSVSLTGRFTAAAAASTGAAASQSGCSIAASAAAAAAVCLRAFA